MRKYIFSNWELRKLNKLSEERGNAVTIEKKNKLQLRGKDHTNIWSHTHTETPLKTIPKDALGCPRRPCLNGTVPEVPLRSSLTSVSEQAVLEYGPRRPKTPQDVRMVRWGCFKELQVNTGCVDVPSGLSKMFPDVPGCVDVEDVSGRSPKDYRMCGCSFWIM